MTSNYRSTTAILASLPSLPLSGMAQAPAALALHTPNFSARPVWISGLACVLLHATADGGNETGAEQWMCNSKAGVSAHLHIRRDGTVVRLVSDHLRAWHAGVSEWYGCPSVNDFSLGWELANRNDGIETFTDAQYESIAGLAAHYVRQGLPLDSFVSHAQVARPARSRQEERRY